MRVARRLSVVGQHGRLQGSLSWVGYGCFGQFAAVVVVFGHVNSTTWAELEVKVTPLGNRMFLMIGVIGV